MHTIICYTLINSIKTDNRKSYKIVYSIMILFNHDSNINVFLNPSICNYFK